jgi:hypothetical protein
MSTPDLPDVPSWVVRMREAGYDVRIGTEPGGLPEIPEVHFTLPRPPRMGLRRRLVARRLSRGREPRSHLVRATSHASLP